jgi:hypothetical protein
MLILTGVKIRETAKPSALQAFGRIAASRLPAPKRTNAQSETTTIATSPTTHPAPQMPIVAVAQDGCDRGGDNGCSDLRRQCERPHSQPLSLLRQAGLSEAVDKVVSYRCIAQRLGAEPMGDREMRVGDQEQVCFSPRLLTVAQLRKRSSQEFA